MLEEYKKRQPIAYKMITNIIKNHKYSHAYLFETKTSTDGLKMAIDFAKYLLSNGLENTNDYNTELKIINPDGMWIKKEQLDELQKEFSKKAIIGDKKIYIINQAEKLNQYAANSILKFLEEPEDNIIAILVTDNKYQLLDTIISRCQIISLINKNKELIDETLENQTILRLKSLLFNQEKEEQKFLENGEEIVEKIIKFVDCLETNPLNTILNEQELWLNTFKEREANLKAFEIMTLYYKDLINRYFKRKLDIFVDYYEEIDKLLTKIDINKIYKHLKIILEHKKNITKNVNIGLFLDKFIMSIDGKIN